MCAGAAVAGTGGGSGWGCRAGKVFGNEPDPPGICGISPRPGAGKGTIHPHPQETGGAEGTSVLPQLELGLNVALVEERESRQ